MWVHSSQTKFWNDCDPATVFFDMHKVICTNAKLRGFTQYFFAFRRISTNSTKVTLRKLGMWNTSRKICWSFFVQHLLNKKKLQVQLQFNGHHMKTCLQCSITSGLQKECKRLNLYVRKNMYVPQFINQP